MKFQSFLDKLFETETDAVFVSRSTAKVSKKKQEVERETITLRFRDKSYTFIKMDSGDWVRWAND